MSKEVVDLAGPDLPHVDVVLATNRISPFLRETLASLDSQTLQNWHLVVVDDGCAEPEKLVDMVGGRGIFVRQPPSGLGAARNRGLAHCTSPLVTFLDDDDRWHPERLEQLARAWANRKEAVAVFSAGEYIDGLGHTFGQSWAAEQAPMHSFLSGEQPLPRIVATAYTLRVCKDVGGFRTDMDVAEDLDFTLKVARQGTLLAVPTVLVQYRRHHENMSRPSSPHERDVVCSMLARQAQGARERGEMAAAILIKENLRRARARMSKECARSLIVAVKTRCWTDVAEELNWASHNAVAIAITAVRVSGARVRQWLRS